MCFFLFEVARIYNCYTFLTPGKNPANKFFKKKKSKEKNQNTILPWFGFFFGFLETRYLLPPLCYTWREWYLYVFYLRFADTHFFFSFAIYHFHVCISFFAPSKGDTFFVHFFFIYTYPMYDDAQIVGIIVLLIYLKWKMSSLKPAILGKNLCASK